MRRAFKFLVLVAILAGIAPVFAQFGPSEDTFDRIFQDISSRIGRTIVRNRVPGSWTWEEIIVNDDNLGCPNGGRAAPGQTRAFKVTVIIDGTGVYEYRVSLDNRILFFCTGEGLGATTPAPPSTLPGPGTVAPPPVFPAQPPANTQPTTFQPPVIAYLGFDGNVYVTSLGINPGPVPITGDAQGGISTQSVYYEARRLYNSLRWSPDGARLLFRADDRLYVATSGQPPIQVATGLAPGIPGAWSPDGSEIAYAVETRQSISPASPDQILQVQALPATGGQPRVVGQIIYGYGCGGGGGGFSPATILLFNDVGYNGFNQTFEWLTNGILHTTRCTGTGLALSALDGKRIWDRPDLARAALSPDKTRIIATKYNPQTNQVFDLEVLDVGSGQAISTMSIPMIDRVAWSGDGGSIIYSTITLRAVISGNPNLPSPPLPAWPVNAPINALQLFAMPAAGGQALQIFAGEGFAIGTITPAASNLVAFTLIESDAAMVQRINENARPDSVSAAAPRTRVGVAALPPGVSGYPYLFDGNGSQPAISRVGEFRAVPAQVQPFVSSVVSGGDNPLGLVIGGRAVVPPGLNVNMRTDPTTVGSNVIGIIRPGDTVTILAGPRFSDGLRWWQVRRDADGEIGWVADVDRQGVPNLQPIR